MICKIYTCKKEQFAADRRPTEYRQIVGGYPSPIWGTQKLEKGEAAKIAVSGHKLSDIDSPDTLIEFATDQDGDPVFIANWSGTFEVIS